jgi:lysophospholipase L1-like esterase
LSDWVDYTSFPRIDGIKYPAISTRAYISTAGTISVFGNNADVYTQWATRPDGRVNIMRSQDGDHVTTVAGFTSVTNENQSPIIGVRYRGAGSVITIMGDGDSITESVGSTYRGDGWGFRAAEALSDQLGIAVEWANTGWAGSFYSSGPRRVGDALAAGVIPDICIFPNGSPNSISTTIDSAAINAFRLLLMKSVLSCFDYEVMPVAWTMLPANYNGSQAKQYGATDALRVAYNAETLGLGAKGIYAIDFAGPVSGAAHATGQVEFAAGLTNDGLHPNSACEDVLRDVLAAAIGPLITPY